MTRPKSTKVIVENIQIAGDTGKLLPIKIPQDIAAEVRMALAKSVLQIFQAYGGGAQVLKGRKTVYIKPNGIDTKAYCYTRVEVIEAVINYLKSCGAEKIYLLENSTQSNYTRIVFDVIGYAKMCKRTGAKPIYLDEESTVTYEFQGEGDSDLGYDLKTFEMPKTVVEELIHNRVDNFYLNMPKLKTHSMSGVTLAVKNQWGFPRHADRKYDHNFNLHSKLVDVLAIIRPDFTIIDGMEGTIHGHYPPTALVEKLTIPFRILIGGKNCIATDLVGARIFGLGIQDVPHLRIALERNLGDGVSSLEDIEVIGDLSKYTTTYPYDITDDFPPDVKIIGGKELWCREGCKNNPLTLLQVLYLDYGGTGGFTMVLGKGFDTAEIDAIPGPVFVGGHCAIEEVGERLLQRLGEKQVYFSDGCNNLAQTAAALLRLMKVSALKLVPQNPIRAIFLLALAKLHKTQANVPSVMSKWIKTV